MMGDPILIPNRRDVSAERRHLLDQTEIESHLSQIETHWTAVIRAHRAGADDGVMARAELLERYGGAVHRYLLASLRDVEAADDLAQEFALRFLRGDFKNADPGRGRFRDFLKRAVYHLSSSARSITS
jgi:RNA polymerase sigma-70 factor (ECF subfamily)